MTKLYIGGIFERETTGTTVRNIHYIQAAGEVFAVYTAETTGATTLQSTRYLHRDHLGSVQTLTNETGAVVEVLSFDPWGLRRNAQDWSPATAPIVPSIDRGFTGHEHLDEVSLIHMNGRVYDPVIGRFLSADPFVQAPEYSQSLNRYSYVLNNPLSLTDPSGYFFKGLFRFLQRNAIARTVISVGIGYLTAGAGLAAFTDLGWDAAFTAINSLQFKTISQAIVSAAGYGFGSSFSGALLSGADLTTALTAGARSALISGIESAALFGVNKYLTEPEVLKIHESLKDKIFSLTERFKAQLPSIIARGTIRGIIGEVSGDGFSRLFENSLLMDTISVGRDLLVEEHCLDLSDCLLETRRLTALPGTKSFVGRDAAETTGFETLLFSDAGILRVTQYIPGVNSASAFHDAFVTIFGIDRSFLNQSTIAPVFTLNFLALGVGLSDRAENENFIRLRSF